jgi:DNA methylase
LAPTLVAAAVTCCAADDSMTGFLPGMTPGSEAEIADRKLATRFGVPPFTVLDARQGYWRQRKNAWLQLGIQSEIGRSSDPDNKGDELRGTMTHITAGTAPEIAARFMQCNSGGKRLATLPAAGLRDDAFAQALRDKSIGARRLGAEEIAAQGSSGLSGLTYGAAPAAAFDYYRVKEGAKESSTVSGTSVFDPVLCELFYSWFTPPGSTVLDPFAGGSVRGIVASRLGRRYVGIELREEQLDANQEQACDICRPDDPVPRWLLGDARDVVALAGSMGPYGGMLSCPPYGSLERYSDDERDLSTLDWPEFASEYRKVITACCALLAPNRFAAFCVGDFRDKAGAYRCFPEYTAACFAAAGLTKYNHFILVTPAGSLPLRVGAQFSAGRKAGTSHQHLLVFVKGDGRAAADACGPVDVNLDWVRQETDRDEAEMAPGMAIGERYDDD